ncbi:uncharacterized protein N7518_009727 [Penicillium psychrosexuale]|uniref:uncharacterized protein n=1 Tax=Penicillium psychrosexuale TaxID=1002107 RepID=UPI002544D7BF|nr:uncharacterized protein N7518_009727 [Penicillium psychrosexuale]KAJ5784050.1 hypothetical protein N7518_009727 [Penicillium psychrosexuale]
MSSKLPPRRTRADHNAEEWWALLEIPKTEEEWEDAASNPYIPPTSAKSETEKSKGKEPAKTTDKPQKAPDPRHGKRIRDLHVREMKGCLSASKIGLPEYLTGRIIWHKAKISDLSIDENQSKPLTDVQKGLGFEKAAREFAAKYQTKNTEFKRYYKHIKKYGSSLRDDERRCTGEYAFVRDLQLNIIQRPDIEDQHLRELSEKARICEMWARSQEDPSETTSGTIVTGHQKGETDETMMSGDTLNATLRSHDNIVSREQRSDDITMGEEVTNTSLMQFLGTLCLDFPRESKRRLMWNPCKPYISFMQKESRFFLRPQSEQGDMDMDRNDQESDRPAKKQKKSDEDGRLILYADGQLVNPQNRNDIHCIVEVKSNLLRSKTGYENFLRQMGWEMLFWIANCHKLNLMKNRWIMMAECADEVYLVIARFEQPWLDYISGEDPEDNQPGDSFLHLYLAGPLSVYNHKHVKLFGKFVVTFTKQQLLDIPP